MKKERCIYEFKQGNAEANLTIDFISKRFAIRPCIEMNASFDGDSDIDYINNLVDDYVGMLADIKQFALAELFGYGVFEAKDISIDGGTISWDTKKPITVSANEIKGAKELIQVDSLVEVHFELDYEQDIRFDTNHSLHYNLHDYCKLKNINQTKIKRIFLEMEK